MVSIYGYKPTGNPALFSSIATADSINQRAYIGNEKIGHGWATSMFGRIGRFEATIPDGRLAAWEVEDAEPTDLLSFVDEFSMGTYMTSASDGTTYGGDLNTTFQMWDNERYAPGFIIADARGGYGHNEIASGTPESVVYNTEYRRTVAGVTTAQDPFDASSSAARGHIAVWIEYDINVAPDRPLNGTALPVDNAIISTLTPTFENDFTDDNEILSNGLTGDSMKSAKILLRVKSTNALVWSYKYDVTSGERAAARFSRVYNGPALTAGVEYTWTCIVYDQFDTASDNMLYIDFTPGTGEFDVSSGSPHGVHQTTTPGPFTGVWDNPGGLDVEEIQVRITGPAPNYTVLQTGTWFTLVPTIGDTEEAEIAWADSGLTDLQPGGDYAYQLRGDDTDDVTSGWSLPRTFGVNAPPDIPSWVAPLPPESSESSRPLLILEASDPDDTSGTGLEVRARIKDSAGVVLFTRNTTYDAVTDTWQYQTTATDLAATGDFKFDAWAYDQVFYSGGNTVLGAGALSEEITFHYTSGPSVVINEPDPSDVVVTLTPTIDWTMTDQERKRVRIWDAAEQEYEFLLYDSGEITSIDTDLVVPEGYLEDLSSYWVQVSGWNSLNEEGTSAVHLFTTDVPDAIDIEDFDWAPHSARGDITPTSILLSWGRTNYDDADFWGYILTRRAASNSLFDVDDDVGSINRRIAVLRSPSETHWVDYLPASGIDYTYGISQVVIVDGVTLRSPIVRLDATVDFKETVICDARQAGARRVVLRYRKNRQINRVRDQEFRIAWNQSKPTTYRTGQWYRDISAEFLVVGDTPADVQEQMLELDKLDYYGGPLCYRDGRGRRYFGEIETWNEIDQPSGAERVVNIDFKQTAATEVENR